MAKSRAGMHKLTEPYRDHSNDFLSKAKSIIKKLFQKMDQVHPDCNSDPVQPMVEENDEIWQPSNNIDKRIIKQWAELSYSITSTVSYWYSSYSVR